MKVEKFRHTDGTESVRVTHFTTENLTGLLNELKKHPGTTFVTGNCIDLSTGELLDITTMRVSHEDFLFSMRVYMTDNNTHQLCYYNDNGKLIKIANLVCTEKIWKKI